MAAVSVLSVPTTFVLHGLHGVELARRDLLQGGGMEDVIGSLHRIPESVGAAHVSDVELQLVAAVQVPHVVLLLLVAAEDADLGDFRGEKPPQDRVAEGSRSAGNQQCLVREHQILLSASLSFFRRHCTLACASDSQRARSWPKAAGAA